MQKFRIIAAFLAAMLLLFSLAACGGKQAEPDTPAETPDDMIRSLLDLMEEDPAVGEEANAILDRLDASDPQAGVKWREIAAAFEELNTEEELNYGCAPDGLPEDGTLCFIVLGYQLHPDGSMDDELIGRLETALACAEKYPNALIAVTGGGTAADNDEATEADCMAEWLEDNGISEERILIENRSLTTGQNATYTAKLLREEHPEVQSLVIVTSDYHVRCGWMCFDTEMILAGDAPRVVSNAAYDAKHSETSLNYQTMWMENVWEMQ